MEENKEDTPVEGSTGDAAANGGDENQGEGLLVDAARAIGSTLGKAAGALGGAEDAEALQPRHRHQEKIGLVTSDKMEKTVVVRVERQVRHTKYKRYIRRRTKFMAHNELGAGKGDVVRIIETRPLSARKRWRVIEILQKAR